MYKIPIRLLIVDDHQIFRQGLISLFKGVEEVMVVGEVSNGNEAVESAMELEPDVVLLDSSFFSRITIYSY